MVNDGLLLSIDGKVMVKWWLITVKRWLSDGSWWLIMVSDAQVMVYDCLFSLMVNWWLMMVNDCWWCLSDGIWWLTDG